MHWKRELGRQIRDARKAAGLTQGGLADRLGVSRQMITRYEGGSDPPAIEVLAAAARLLGVTFRVHGVLITSGEESGRGPRSMAQQLVLPFMEKRKFKRAVVEITRQRGRILISATIPA